MNIIRRLIAPTLLLAVLAACEAPPLGDTPPANPEAQLPPEVVSRYGPIHDAGVDIPAVPAQYLNERTIRTEVDYWGDYRPGTIVVDPWERFLYYVLEGDRAIRYGIGVGDEGRAFAGEGYVPYSRDWPSWRPTANMIREFPDMYGPLREGMEGGLWNPLGARALYIHRNNRDTYYRIHGTSDMSAIGNATTAGCIRMFHQDVIELERMYKPGARVVVLTEAQSGMGTRRAGGPELALASR
ncbi:MAG: L,D-transpeptidase [Paracoccaceae bacterium]